MKENQIQCPECGNLTDSTLSYCDACGCELKKVCPHCEQVHREGTRFCPRTGKSTGAQSIWSQTAAIIVTSFSTMACRWVPSKAAVVFGLMFLGGFIAMYFNGFDVLNRWNINIERVQVPRIDVIFAIDTTGSMADEIQTVKEKIRDMAGDIKRGRPSPDVRFGLVAYRDKGDEYVVKSFPFTRDMNRFSSLVSGLRADGGGDTPESVNEALDVSVNRMDWGAGQGVQKLVFLIGDAEPHMDYRNGLDYRNIERQASRKGISIHTIACSGIDSVGQNAFREIASLSGGSFDFLTYQVAYRAPSGKTHYMLNAGGRNYRVEEKCIRDESWKCGASVMEKAGRAMKLDTCSSMPDAPGLCRSAESMISAGAAKNNLDCIMTSVVKEKARRAGVSY